MLYCSGIIRGYCRIPASEVWYFKGRSLTNALGCGCFCLILTPCIFTYFYGTLHYMTLTHLQWAHQGAVLVNSLCFSLTASVVMLQTMKQIPPSIYNLYELLGGIVIVITGFYLSRESLRNALERYLAWILVIDYTILVVVQLLSVESLVARFIALALVFPVNGEVRYSLMSDYINKALVGGEITTFNQKLRYSERAGVLAGFALALLGGYMGIVASLEIALVIQVLGNIPIAVTPLAWKEFYTQECEGHKERGLSSLERL